MRTGARRSGDLAGSSARRSRDRGVAARLERVPLRGLIAGAIAIVIGLGPGAAPLRADVFRLKDGRRIEGTVVREIGDLLSIKTADGIVTVGREEIVERIAAKTPFDKYKERLAAAAPDNVDQQLELARWCAAEGLAAESTFHYKRVIELAADHEEAREKLGYIWFAGGWYREGSPELAARKAELEATPAEQPPEIPEGDVASAPEAVPDLPPLPANAEAIALVLDEKLDKDPPRRSSVPYELGLFLGKLPKPMRAIPGLDPSRAKLEIRVKVRIFFVKTVKFYETPVYHLFQGEAEAEIFERGADGSARSVGKVSAKRNFSSSIQNPMEKGMGYTYFATVERLADQLALSPYFRDLGAKVPDRTRRPPPKDPKAPKTPPPAAPKGS